MNVTKQLSNNISDIQSAGSFLNQKEPVKENSWASPLSFEDILSENKNKASINSDKTSAAGKSPVSPSKTSPYGELADDTGLIHYNGVTFQWDANHNTLSLGDTSDDSKILKIPLSMGGTLKVNVNNIDELARAIGMFSAQDQRRILDALATYARIQKKLNEFDTNVNEVYQDLAVRK